MSQIGAELQLFHGAVDADPATEILGITDLQFPEQAGAVVKNTTYATPDKQHDYLPGFTEGGEVVVTMNFTAVAMTATEGLKGTRKAWKVTVGGDEGGDIEFEGFVSKFGPGLPVDEKLTLKFSIQVCTKPVWTAAA
jgi:hypothetical protein